MENMNLLEKYQKTEIREAISQDVILYEPTEDQIMDIRKILTENMVSDSDEFKIKNATSCVRYVFRNLVKDGNCVDEYTDEELVKKYNNAKGNLKKLRVAIEELLDEVAQDMLQEQIDYINMYTKIVQSMSVNTDINKMKKAISKMAKTNGYDIKPNEVGDILAGKFTKDDLRKKKIRKK